jgi:translocation and assembly module TamA
VAAETALVSALGDTGHPFAKVADRRVEIDTDAHTMEVTYTLDPGPVMHFGPLAIEGLERLDPAYVEGRLRWQRGQIYEAGKVEETRRALIETGLFSTVRITPTADPDNPDDVRMTIDATERLHRTIGVGFAYNTSQGAGVRAFWENRNLFGNAEYLRVNAEVGQQIDAFRANFRRPDFLTIDQDFLATAEIANDTPVAYHSRRAVALVGIERRFDRLLTGGIALQVTKANVTQLANVSSLTAAQRTQHYSLVGVPAYLKLDETDSLLNPTRGYRVQLGVTPSYIFSAPHSIFVSNTISGSTYWALGAQKRAVLAGKVALASLDGTPLFQLPADQRIYAGGGGSIRPYGYQLAGPLDSNNKPIGGKSSFVLNLEARIKITENIGIVPFVDAGSYYESPVPQLGRTLLYGVGLGLRYYTAFGPLRLDLATPLHKRSADSPIQVYISLGQAF